ncbi:MAG: outer membrane protein assembly factor BamD [Gammaproteobacteria bacterium]|nr:outer membrane protein assembly factor BamD [Gammaproteobacteria bacterium]
MLANEGKSANQVFSRTKCDQPRSILASTHILSRHYIDNFPTDQRIPQALLSIAYAHYQLGGVESSAKITSNFIEPKKSYALLDYAFYLHGLARYSAGIKKLQSNEVVSNNRDSLAREAFESFLQVVAYYPNSQYHEDSRTRMEALFNSLADNKLVLAKRVSEQDKNHEAIARAEYIRRVPL